jgi:hypothetical protein
MSVAKRAKRPPHSFDYAVACLSAVSEPSSCGSAESGSDQFHITEVVCVHKINLWCGSGAENSKRLPRKRAEQCRRRFFITRRLRSHILAGPSAATRRVAGIAASSACCRAGRC